MAAGSGVALPLPVVSSISKRFRAFKAFGFRAVGVDEGSGFRTIGHRISCCLSRGSFKKTRSCKRHLAARRGKLQGGRSGMLRRWSWMVGCGRVRWSRPRQLQVAPNAQGQDWERPATLGINSQVRLLPIPLDHCAETRLACVRTPKHS